MAFVRDDPTDIDGAYLGMIKDSGAPPAGATVTP